MARFIYLEKQSLRKGFLLFFLFGVVIFNLQAQFLSSQDNLNLQRHDTSTFANDKNKGRPAFKSADQKRFIKTSAYILAGAGAWYATFGIADEPMQRFSQSHRNPIMDKVAFFVEPLGKQKNLVPVVGIAFAGGLIANNKKLQKVGLIAFGSILTNGALTSSLKNAFQRHRPSSSAENDLFDGPFQNTGNSSLPSSHTSTAFTVATSIATVYSDNKWVPPIAYGVATMVGLSRINDNAHWATDVMAGAVVGYVSSKCVSYIYKKADQKLKNRRQKILVIPEVGLQSMAITTLITF